LLVLKVKKLCLLLRRNERRQFVTLETTTSHFFKTPHGAHAFLYACALGGIVLEEAGPDVKRFLSKYFRTVFEVV